MAPEVKRILVAEDDAPLRLATKIFLENFVEGTQVLTASTKKQALAVLENNQLEWVVTDLEMDDPRAGVEITQQAVQKSIKVIMITAAPDKIPAETHKQLINVIVKNGSTSPGLAAAKFINNYSKPITGKIERPPTNPISRV